MSRAVVLALLLFCIFTTNGKRRLRETESLYEQLANQFDEVDRLPEGAFIEDSSGDNPCNSGPCKNGGTCSVTEGDSYTCQCAAGFGGQTCEQDVDECKVNNDGCSHDCTNTIGSYICACLDPELSLADNKHTCEAKGVVIECLQNEMSITIPKTILKGMDREHLRLLDSKCEATETDTHFDLKTPLTGCNTKRSHTKSAIVYSNKVLEIPLKQSDIITRVREIEIPFSCFFSNSRGATAVGVKPENRKLVFSEKGKGNFTVMLEMFHRQSYETPYSQDDFPVSLKLRQQIYLQAKVDSDDKRLGILAEKCLATPTPNEKDPKKHLILQNGCAVDDTVKTYSSPQGSFRFGLEAFEFVDQPFVFVHCHTVICNASDAQSRCAQGCQKNARVTRDVEDHNVYSLAQGPITVDYTADHLVDFEDDHLNLAAKKVETADGVNVSLLATAGTVTAVTIFGVIYTALKRRSRDAHYLPFNK